MKAVNRYSGESDIAAAVEQLQKGASFAAGELTLTAASLTTTVPRILCSPRSQVFLTAKTATAAAATGVYVVAGTQEFVVHHNSTADTDRTFSFRVENTDTD